MLLFSGTASPVMSIRHCIDIISMPFLRKEPESAKHGSFIYISLHLKCRRSTVDNWIVSPTQFRTLN